MYSDVFWSVESSEDLTKDLSEVAEQPATNIRRIVLRNWGCGLRIW